MKLFKKFLCIMLCASVLAAPAQAGVWESLCSFFSSTQSRVVAVVGSLFGVYWAYNIFLKKNKNPKKAEKKPANKSTILPTNQWDGWDIPKDPHITDQHPGPDSHVEYLSTDKDGKISTVALGETACIGRERIIPCTNTRGIWLKQVVVADQHSSDPSNKGGDASCGYHCVKNFAAIAKAINHPEDAGFLHHDLTSFDTVNNLFGKYKDKQPGTYRKHVTKNNSQIVDGGDWITDEDIDSLIKEESKPLGLLAQDLFGLSVIENISQEKIPAEGEIPQDVQQARESAINKEIERARSSLDEATDCAYGFILNDFQGGNRGHWFVVVIKKYMQQNQQPKIDVIIADSKNIVRFNNPSVRALLQKLFGVNAQPDLNEIQRLQKELNEYMPNLEIADVRQRAEKLNSVYLALGGEDIFTEKILAAIPDEVARPQDESKSEE